MIITKRVITYCSISSVMLLAGCAGLGGIDGNDRLSLRSKPSGAEVYIMEQSIGRTPISISQQTLYPSTYPQDLQHLYGEIMLKKAGCQDYRRRVSSRDFTNGVDAMLDCGKDVAGNRSATAATAPAMPKKADALPEQPVAIDSEIPEKNASQSAKQRLSEINELKEEGLINEQEYRTIRQRILDSL